MAAAANLLIEAARLYRPTLEPEKRQIILGLLDRRWEGDAVLGREGSTVCSEEVILDAAGYTGKSWWHGWLHDGLTHEGLAHLAAAMAPSYKVHWLWRRALHHLGIVKINKGWVAGAIDFEPWPPLRPIGSQPAPLRRAEVELLLDHPDLALDNVPAGMLPASLLEHLRPAPPRAAAVSLGLRPAPVDLINEQIRAVYDEAENAGARPPNVKELPPVVQTKLAEQGYSVSRSKIADLAGREPHKFRRLKQGTRWPRRG